MIKLENTEVLGWEAAIRGMRNPMNSWDKSDSAIFKGFDFNGDYYFCDINHNRKDWTDWFYLGEEPPKDELGKWVRWWNKRKLWKGEPCPKPYHDDENAGKVGDILIGPSDHKLMMNLAKASSVDAKYRRMIVVTVDITAPLYWWKEFDTYKVGSVANSCSTMHKIQAKEFTLDDFSHEHLFSAPDFDDIPHFEEKITEDDFYDEDDQVCDWHINNGAYYADVMLNECDGDYVKADYALDVLNTTIEALNYYREKFLETKDKRYWWQLIQLLPSSYNQRRTVMLNYEVLAGIYPKRKDHKLDCWHDFCSWIKSLPYSEIITLEE